MLNTEAASPPPAVPGFAVVKGEVGGRVLLEDLSATPAPSPVAPGVRRGAGRPDSRTAGGTTGP